MLLTSAFIVDIVAVTVGLAVSDGRASTRLAGAVLLFLIYGGLALIVRRRPRAVALVIVVLATSGAAANVVSPNPGQLLVAVLSGVSAGLALAALRSLRTPA